MRVRLTLAQKKSGRALVDRESYWTNGVSHIHISVVKSMMCYDERKKRNIHVRP